jgi:hypothetical protein
MKRGKILRFANISEKSVKKTALENLKLRISQKIETIIKPKTPFFQ